MGTTAPINDISEQRAAGARVPWRMPALVAGDAASFLVFAAAGLSSHHQAVGPATIVTTAIPFALGWYLVAPFAGAFRQRVTSGVVPMLRRTELAWMCAWPLTLLLRWALAPDHQVPLSFAIVILITNALFLGIWRSAFALLARP